MQTSLARQLLRRKVGLARAHKRGQEMRVVDIADAENGTKTNYQYRMRERVYVTVFESKSNRQISNCVKVKLLKWVTSATRKRGRTRMKRENEKKMRTIAKTSVVVQKILWQVRCMLQRGGTSDARVKHLAKGTLFCNCGL